MNRLHRDIMNIVLNYIAKYKHKLYYNRVIKEYTRTWKEWWIDYMDCFGSTYDELYIANWRSWVPYDIGYHDNICKMQDPYDYLRYNRIQAPLPKYYFFSSGNYKNMDMDRYE
jgi:hypothetical protein